MLIIKTYETSVIERQSPSCDAIHGAPSQMNDLRAWCENYSPALVGDSLAEVDLFPVDEDILVESTSLNKGLSSKEHARTINPIDTSQTVMGAPPCMTATEPLCNMREPVNFGVSKRVS